MNECNKDCIYWQEGAANCKVLTYQECPEHCKWKQTAAERRHRKRAVKARIYNIPKSLDDTTPVRTDGATVPLVQDSFGNVYKLETIKNHGTKHILGKFYGIRSVESLEGD
jgi:hypothetical protein